MCVSVCVCVCVCVYCATVLCCAELEKQHTARMQELERQLEAMRASFAVRLLCFDLLFLLLCQSTLLYCTSRVAYAYAHQLDSRRRAPLPSPLLSPRASRSSFHISKRLRALTRYAHVLYCTVQYIRLSNSKSKICIFRVDSQYCVVSWTARSAPPRVASHPFSRI